MTAKRYTAAGADEATETVKAVHAAIVRGAALLMGTDPRIEPGGAVTAFTSGYLRTCKADHPAIWEVYRASLALLGIGRGDMDYRRFMSFVPAEHRLRLAVDRKVAGR